MGTIKALAQSKLTAYNLSLYGFTSLLLTMPEGPLGAPRLTNVGPLSRSTKEEIRIKWRRCPLSGKPNEICKATKKASLTVLEEQGIFADYETLEDINSGCCNRVASIVVKQVDGVTAMKAGDWDHVWIEYNGRHYDAEVPTGVDQYKDLPFFGRISERQLLDMARMASRAMDKDEPETFEDTVKDVTDQIDERDEVL
jgi:hypothetical protein